LCTKKAIGNISSGEKWVAGTLQVAIILFEVLEGGKQFWFLKFLIPKLTVVDPNQDTLDELIDSVDLSSYGLERAKLNQNIGFDSTQTKLGSQNPTTRGCRDGEPKADPLDEIVRSFSERWFQGWSATPQEQRVKFVNIAESDRARPDFREKYENNPDPQNRS
jgi:type I restriction enzyme R subunit